MTERHRKYNYLVLQYTHFHCSSVSLREHLVSFLFATLHITARVIKLCSQNSSSKNMCHTKMLNQHRWYSLRHILNVKRTLKGVIELRNMTQSAFKSITILNHRFEGFLSSILCNLILHLHYMYLIPYFLLFFFSYLLIPFLPSEIMPLHICLILKLGKIFIAKTNGEILY